MKLFVVALSGAILMSVLSTPAAHAAYPECGQIQQPKVLNGVATDKGAQFAWENKGSGATYQTWVNRYYNGEWHRDDAWGEVGGALGQFVPWEENGITADSVSLSVIQNCYGQAWGVPFTVERVVAPAVTPTSQTSYVLLTPNKKWTEVTIRWAPVSGATEYRVEVAAPRAGARCSMTLTGTSFLWTKDSTCEMPGRYGSYSAWVTPIGPGINGVLTSSEYVQHDKPQIRCVKKSNLKVKKFSRKKCPRGWVER